MIYRLILVVLTATAGPQVLGSDRPSLPRDVPPVHGTAVVVDPDKPNASNEWRIRLTVPKIHWQVVGKVLPKKRWPKLTAKVKKVTLTLILGGPSALAPSRIVDVKGKELSRAQIVDRLKKETHVLVSVSGRMPDAYFLQLTRADALIVILGPRNRSPLPHLLAAKKPSR